MAGASTDTKAEYGQLGLFIVYPPKWIANGATLVKQLALELPPIQSYSLKHYPDAFLLRMFSDIQIPLKYIDFVNVEGPS